MSFHEKRSWTYGAVSLILTVIYIAIVFPQLASMGVSKINYVQPMLIAIGASIVLSIIVDIVISISKPKEANIRDERDTQIDRRVNSLGFFLISFLVLVPLGFAMAEFAPFWIANAIYFASALTAVVTSAVKVVLYRRDRV